MDLLAFILSFDLWILLLFVAIILFVPGGIFLVLAILAVYYFLGLS